MEGAITTYLADLRGGLRCSRWRKDALLAEAEDHLREAAAVLGDDHEDAEREAIRRFGPPNAVARQLSGAGWYVWTVLHWYLYVAMFVAVVAMVAGAALALSGVPALPFDEVAGSWDVRVWHACTAVDPALGGCTTWAERRLSAALAGGILLAAAGCLIAGSHWAARRALLDATDAATPRGLFYRGGSALIVGGSVLLFLGATAVIIAGGPNGHLIWLPAGVLAVGAGATIRASGGAGHGRRPVRG